MKKFIYWIFGFIFLVYPFVAKEITFEINSSQILLGPSISHWGGTDSLGRDLLFRCLAGGYLSLLIGVLSLLITYFLGVIVGSILSYWRQANHLFILFVDIFDSVPNFLLVALFSILFNRGLQPTSSMTYSFLILVFSIALSTWPPIARNVRLEILQLSGLDYLNATVVAGGSSLYIVRTHYFRALWPWLKTSIAQNIPQFFLLESILSFTGFGLQTQTPTIGYLIYEGWKNTLSHPHLFIVPSLVLCLLIFLLVRLVPAEKI